MPDPLSVARESLRKLSDEKVSGLVIAARSFCEEKKNALPNLVRRGAEDDGHPIADAAAYFADRDLSGRDAFECFVDCHDGLGPDPAVAIDGRAAHDFPGNHQRRLTDQL